MAFDDQAPPPAAEEVGPPPLEWKRDSQGREYVAAIGRRGVVRRQGTESVEEALARDQQPKDERPKRKTPAKKPPPKKADLKELEAMLAEAFKAPAVPAAAFGDIWAAEHFTEWGPNLARNLVLASETNPWLRRKLENAASGGDMMMQLISMVGVAGAFGMYVVPPLVWWLNIPIPDRGREILGVPQRRDHNGPNPAAEAA